MRRYKIEYRCKGCSDVRSWDILCKDKDRALELFNQRINPVERIGTWPKEIIRIYHCL